MIVSTESIVLHSRKYSDTSKILTFFTKDEGKLNLMAKGARNSKNKFGSALSPLSYTQVDFYKKSQRDLHIVSKAELIQSWNKIINSYEHLTVAMMISESLYQTLQENEKNEELFGFVIDTFQMMNNSDENIFSFYIYFELALIKFLGFEIDFEPDYRDYIQNKSELIFSLDSGTLTKEKRTNLKNFYIFDFETYDKLKNLSEVNPESVSGISVESKFRTRIQNFFSYYFSYHLERKFYNRTFNMLKA